MMEPCMRTTEECGRSPSWLLLGSDARVSQHRPRTCPLSCLLSATLAVFSEQSNPPGFSRTTPLDTLLKPTNSVDVILYVKPKFDINSIVWRLLNINSFYCICLQTKTNNKV